MHLDWDYKKRTVDISIPEYVKEALNRFQHPNSKQPIHAPSKYIPPDYGIKKQREHIDTGRPMTPVEKKRLQQVVGVFLYYVRSVDPTMLHALNVLATQ